MHHQHSTVPSTSLMPCHPDWVLANPYYRMRITLCARAFSGLPLMVSMAIAAIHVVCESLVRRGFWLHLCERAARYRKPVSKETGPSEQHGNTADEVSCGMCHSQSLIRFNACLRCCAPIGEAVPTHHEADTEVCVDTTPRLGAIIQDVGRRMDSTPYVGT